MRRILVLLGALALGCGETPSDPVLKFTAIPGDNTTDLKAKFAPFEKHMSLELGVPVEYVTTTHYAASVTSFINGDIHLAWFGGLSGVRARDKVPGARAIAQGKADPEYHTYFIAHVDSGLERSDSFPKGLEGKTFTFGSNGSTTGRLMPEYFIRKNTGKTPAEFFGRAMSFSGSHEKTARFVESGQFQAGAIDYKTYERLVAEKEIDPEKCRVIWETPPYPDYNWTAHPDLEKQFGDGFTERLQAALIELKDPALLRAINRPEGLIPAKNEDWDGLRELARELGLVR